MTEPDPRTLTRADFHEQNQASAQAEARRLFGRDPGLPPATRQEYLTPWTAAKAEKQFLARFAGLQAS